MDMYGFPIYPPPKKVIETSHGLSYHASKASEPAKPSSWNRQVSVWQPIRVNPVLGKSRRLGGQSDFRFHPNGQKKVVLKWQLENFL